MKYGKVSKVSEHNGIKVVEIGQPSEFYRLVVERKNGKIVIYKIYERIPEKIVLGGK